MPALPRTWAPTALFPDAGENVRKMQAHHYRRRRPGDAQRSLGRRLLVDPSLHENTNLQQSFFWMNYYAPETVMPSVSLYKALADQ